MGANKLLAFHKQSKSNEGPVSEEIQRLKNTEKWINDQMLITWVWSICAQHVSSYVRELVL